jgi:hypothetical protein
VYGMMTDSLVEVWNKSESVESNFLTLISHKKLISSMALQALFEFGRMQQRAPF